MSGWRWPALSSNAGSGPKAIGAGVTIGPKKSLCTGFGIAKGLASIYFCISSSTCLAGQILSDIEAADGLAGAAGHDLLTALGNPVGSCRVPGGLFLGFHGVRRGVHRHLCGRPVLAQILKGPNLTGGRPRARTPPSVPPAARPAGLVKSLAGLAIAPPARTA